MESRFSFCRCRQCRVSHEHGLFVCVTQQRNLFVHGPYHCCPVEVPTISAIFPAGTRDGVIPRCQHLSLTSQQLTSELRKPCKEQETVAISRRRSQRSCTEQAASRTKGNAAYAAVEQSHRREVQEELWQLYEQTCQEIPEVWKLHNCATMRILEKTEALQEHAKTVTMRADSLASMEADFSKRSSSVWRRRSEISTIWNMSLLP